MRLPLQYSLRELLACTTAVATMCSTLRFASSLVATAVCSVTLLIFLAALVKCTVDGSRECWSFILGCSVYFLIVFGPVDSDFRGGLASTRLLEYSYENWFEDAIQKDHTYLTVQLPYIADERRGCFILIGQCYAVLFSGGLFWGLASYLGGDAKSRSNAK